MCELFGLSASNSVEAKEALNSFRLRGGRDADNPDGWGIAWWTGDSFNVAKEPSPAHESERFAVLCETTCSNLMVAHVRKARFPPVKAMTNTHPFQRTCCGKEWVFAHNGLVPDVLNMQDSDDNPVCQPIGETDSEYAFCHLLSHIARHLESFHAHAGTVEMLPMLARISGLIASNGKFNFLMSDGEYLIAYGHDRLHHAAQGDAILIATEPLNGGGWIPFERGELRIYLRGVIAGRILTEPDTAFGLRPCKRV